MFVQIFYNKLNKKKVTLLSSYDEVLKAMELIQNLSKTNICQILEILKIKYEREIDMNFVIFTLPSLIMKIKIFSIHAQQDDKILVEINHLIRNIIPKFEKYSFEQKYNKVQRKAYITFCKSFALN